MAFNYQDDLNGVEFLENFKRNRDNGEFEILYDPYNMQYVKLFHDGFIIVICNK